jgi:hypothetical protein
MMAGIGVQPEARQNIDAVMDREWSRTWTPPPTPIPEVVIGAGPHALIYAAVRKSMGIDVVVLEKGKVGGSFACSQGDAFYLNSRNRPGVLGLPGENVGLNVLPGCPLQPSMIGGSEYQTNAELAWTIRMNFLALGIEVHTGYEVRDFEGDGTGDDTVYLLDCTNDQVVKAKRVVVATGLGSSKVYYQTSSANVTKPDRLIDFPEFMSKMDTDFPLQGFNKVAVVGAGDSGKTAVEALIGQAPSIGMSVAMLDFPNRIDWYGVSSGTSRQLWCEQNRGRYAGIGKAFGNGRRDENRLAGCNRAPVFVGPGFQSATIGPRSYDWVINCSGFDPSVPWLNGFAFDSFTANGRAVAITTGAQVFKIGPAAGIAISDKDREIAPVLVNIPENNTSLFRYAPLTATFAATLPPVVSNPQPQRARRARPARINTNQNLTFTSA